jgi:hypothetical protein
MSKAEVAGDADDWLEGKRDNVLWSFIGSEDGDEWLDHMFYWFDKWQLQEESLLLVSFLAKELEVLNKILRTLESILISDFKKGEGLELLAKHFGALWD